MAATKNARRWQGRAIAQLIFPVHRKRTASAATVTGCSASIALRGTTGVSVKAKTNVSRYSASGTIQRNGADATSVAMWAVAATSRTEGIKPRAIQARRLDQ